MSDHEEKIMLELSIQSSLDRILYGNQHSDESLVAVFGNGKFYAMGARSLPFWEYKDKPSLYDDSPGCELMEEILKNARERLGYLRINSPFEIVYDSRISITNTFTSESYDIELMDKIRNMFAPHILFCGDHIRGFMGHNCYYQLIMEFNEVDITKLEAAVTDLLFSRAREHKIAPKGRISPKGNFQG